MRTPQEILKSVVFLGDVVGEGESERLRLGGTAFVVSVEEPRGSFFFYLVTARHCVLALAGKRQIIRANSEDGGYASIEIDGGQWWFHHAEEKSVDVAVRPFDPHGLDIVPIPSSMFLGEHEIYDYHIGQGDEVSITGLFTKLTGESKNLPILRRGSIAMFPDQKIPSVKMGDSVQDMDGYLIEARSVGGLSGSPAFVRAPVGVQWNVHTRSGKFRPVWVHLQGDYFLLGLAQGHWEIPPGQRNRIDLPSASPDESSINLGIAIVVPAKKILEVLNHPELFAMRQKKEKDCNNSQGSTDAD